MSPPANEPILRLRGVSRRFGQTPDLAGRVANRMARLLGAAPRPATVQALDRVDLDIHEGETLGLVGESGCGKSTLGRIVAGILEPSEGEITYRGTPLASLDAARQREARLAVQMIFQDPMASLNPRMRAGEAVAEGPRVHRIVPPGRLDAWVDSILARVGLDASVKNRLPHQFSGGQRQRLGIARALAVRPALIVCDEAVAALDVSVQAQVLNLFMELRRDFALAYLFISHDLGVVRHVADRVAVMYLGRIVERADAGRLFESPNHPYTAALLEETPRPGRRRTFVPIRGEIPSPLAPPGGCHFHPRCPRALARCSVDVPALREIAPGHVSACHLNDVQDPGPGRQQPAD